VVEAAVKRAGDPYTPNDCCLDASGEIGARLSIVTGPNMAGKSTFLRQNALLAILAQSGCYVPAASFRLGVVDRLFSRVGAGDDLARGRSTFMMEMVETAAILTQAGPRSLVILDEIGRGTATYDGLAIAWACAEALHDTNRCRALFATHYHELATLEERLGHVSNLSPAGQGMERRPGVPARGRARSRRPLLRRAGGQAGRRARPGGGPRPRGAGPPGDQGPNRRPSWTTCRCSR
jgi:DNA mismatch repair protein MutS